MLEDFHLQEMQLKRPVKPAEIKALRQKIEAVEALTENTSQASSKFSNRPSHIHPLEQLDIIIEKDEPPAKNEKPII